jgi:anthranilate phosphoribosyltransferase
MMQPMIEALGSRGVTSAWVVHGHGGVDEITLAGPCQVMSLRNGEITSFTIHASDIGLAEAPLDAIRGDDPRVNADIARRVLSGETGAPRDTVVLNAAAALFIADAASSLEEGRGLAEASLDTGAARSALERLIASSNDAAKRLEQ